MSVYVDRRQIKVKCWECKAPIVIYARWALRSITGDYLNHCTDCEGRAEREYQAALSVMDRSADADPCES